jgi:hypothetical protein
LAGEGEGGAEAASDDQDVDGVRDGGVVKVLSSVP